MNGAGPDLVDFIMRMCQIDPTRRISAREALRRDWLVGPLLGYWAVAGIEWVPPEGRTGQEETRDNARERSIERAETPAMTEERRVPPFYDFSNSLGDDDIEESDEEVFLVCAESSSTKPLPFLDLTAQEEVPYRPCSTECSGG
jgi:serine/threonine protein kinase